MKECEECGKKLGIVEGYQHPTMGRKHLVCSNCFDQVSESVEKWAEFVKTNSININNLEQSSVNDVNDLKVIKKIAEYSGVASQ